MDPVGDFLVSDVFTAGELEELVGLFLLQLHTPGALLIKLLVALPQLQQCLAAAQTLSDLLQQARPPGVQLQFGDCDVLPRWVTR